MPWVPSGINKKLPRSAIIGGRDSQGNKIYVGRTRIDGDLVPCNVIPATTSAVAINLNSKEVVNTEDFEVLCGDAYLWQKDRNGAVPSGALIAGRTKDGEELYIGRVSYEGALIPGVIQPTTKELRSPVLTQVVTEREYDTLVIMNCDRKCGCAIQ